MAVVNGQFDLAQAGRAGPMSGWRHDGVTPLSGVLNVQWGPKSMYPQPRAQLQQKQSYLDAMRLLIAKGADVNARVDKKVWFTSFNTDLSGVDEIGATPFWRAAYACDVEAMSLLVANGADPNVPSMQPAGRPRTGDGERDVVADTPACRPFRSAARAFRRSSPPPASATAKASPPTCTARADRVRVALK